MEKIILIVFVLTSQSSYVGNSERGSTEANFDTIQWWIGENESYRISTFAIDNDIRIFKSTAELSLEVVEQNTMKHYGDIVGAKYTLEFDSGASQENIQSAVENVIGYGSVEMNSAGLFGFWNSDGRLYKTISSE